MNGEFRAALKRSGPVLLIAVALLFLFVGEPTNQWPATGTGDVELDGLTDSVRIEGDVVEPVSPGVMVSIDLKFTNPHDFAVALTSLTVELQNINAPNADETHSCSLDDFAVNQAPTDLQIPLAAHATNTLSGLGLPPENWPRMGMHNHPANQDGCKEASLTLVYTASAERED
ncbi:hypothetical protein FXN61_28110 [Lentzea sp. PSKA42]|uniref:SipW-cognate class signal peptide n=1 Tax=Lentzea indica TaxID=2604800 RepID=A0ABX1FP61_9PSEU|nr:hypothetical protein [Lentzea indica]NKE60446.1 hypothetical protein [Lentzea indica]